MIWSIVFMVGAHFAFYRAELDDRHTDLKMLKAYMANKM